MPWDSFRKKREGTKRKDTDAQQHLQFQQQQQQPGTSSGSSTPRTASDRRVSALTKEVVQKIKEVDREASTLTTAGVQGLSTRVLDKYEYLQTMPDGTQQTYLCQTVELVKKPGQSLGLYLREGNGVERSDGVFVSRLAEGESLEKAGLLKPGDEILSVNNVNVTQMSIDDVVVMISIPMRLLMKTRFAKCALGDAVKSLDQNFDKPVVVIKKQLPRDESRESSFTDDGGPLASTKPLPTSQTSLGAKLRQQESTTIDGGSGGGGRHPIERKLTLPTGRTVGRPSAPQRSQSDKWSYSRQLAMHTPRVLDNEGRIIEGPNIWQQENNNNNNGNGEQQQQQQPQQHHNHSNGPSDAYQSTLSQTAYIPPPKLQSKLTNPERGMPRPGVSTGGPPVDGGMNQWIDTGGQSAAAMFSPRSVVSDSAAGLHSDSYVYQSDAASGYFPSSGGGAPPTRSALRQPSAFPVTAMYPSTMKANSLPRRQTGRTIRWRNDVDGGGPPGGGLGGISVVNASSDYSDSDGAVSAPELPMSPMAMMPPQFPDSRGRSPHLRSVDDVFSRAEYRAWSMSSSPQQQPGQPGGVGGPPYYPPMQSEPQSAYGSFGREMGPMPDGASIPMLGSFPQYAGGAFYQQPYDEYEQQHMPRPVFPMPGTRSRTLKARSSSLPPRGVLNAAAVGQPIYGGYNDEMAAPGVDGHIRPTVDVSPLPQRRLPLRLAEQQLGYIDGLTPLVGFHPGAASLTGLLLIHIIEGRGLRAHHHHHHHEETPIEMYCVVEVDGEHRARTEVSDAAGQFHWNETFEIDVWECRQADFYVYSWHPQFRHKLRHKGCLQLVEAVLTGQLENRGQCFALSMEPKGQLLIRVGFNSMLLTYRRQLALKRHAYWGIPLTNLVDREGTECSVPIVFKRMIEEIERRGVDTTGLYMLCCSVEKKLSLRQDLEKDPVGADLGADSVPDVNLICSLVKDFIRELPEPLLPSCTYQMMVDAWRVCLPNDKEGNARLMLGVLDCLQRANKCTIMVLMDHLKYVMSQSPHNGLSSSKLSAIFGPLLLCTSQADSRMKPQQIQLNYLDHRLASRLLELLLELWPSRASSSESSGSENSTLNLTSNGSTSLVDLWLQENRVPESTC